MAPSPTRVALALLLALHAGCGGQDGGSGARGGGGTGTSGSGGRGGTGGTAGVGGQGGGGTGGSQTAGAGGSGGAPAADASGTTDIAGAGGSAADAADSSSMTPDAAGEAPLAGGGLGPAAMNCPPGAAQPGVDPLPANPMLTPVKTGLSVTEGALWLAAHKALYFAEFEGARRIHKYTPADKRAVVVVDNVGVNGLTVDHNGMIVAASQDMQRLTRFDPGTWQRSQIPGADSFMGRPFNAVNDVVVRADGNMYFTDPTFLNEGRPGQGVTAYYRLSPQGQVTRLGTGPQPNSPHISPDGRWLYISSSGGNQLWRHPLNPDGTVGPRTDFIAARSESLALDCAGNLYLSANGQLMVYSAGGTRIRDPFGNIPAGITNLTFGGEDGKTLYITARGGVYETAGNIPGLPN